MRQFRLIFIAVTITLIILPLDLFAQNWQLVWSDEFEGSELDQSVWTREVGGNGWGNNELQYYTDRTVNSHLENGLLIITALEENYGGRNYTSARIKTQDKKFFKYGKMEARIKLPFGQGLWPAFWMLGQSFPVVGWPACGEIDIMEMIGGENKDNTVYGTAHWKENGQHQQNGGSYTLNSGIFADDFHRFLVIWNENLIQWYVDDFLYHVVNITSPQQSEFHEDFFFILNVAIGGWAGSPDSSTIFPQTMEVDYVRVYKFTTDVENESELPVDYKLYQNYPNPFNPSTSIDYNLANSTFVTLKVYDGLGNEIATLVNEKQQAGHHSVNFQPDNITSGVYFYRLTTPEYNEIKKMTFIK